MKRKLVAAMMVALLALCCATTAQAAFDVRLSYQGRLTDANGVPIADGSTSMRFDICTDAACASSVWNETQTVTTTDGLFSAILGGTTAITLDFTATAYWLQVTVGGTPYTPTQRIAASAMAVNSDLLDGQHGSYYMPASTDNWVNVTGDTMTGSLTMSGAAADVAFTDAGGVIYNTAGSVTVADNLAATGTITATGAISSSGTVTGTQLISNTATGTAPLTLTSGDWVAHLNADMLDGYHYNDLLSGYDSRYVNVAGDAMTNALTMSGASSKIAFDTASVGLYNTAGDVYINDNLTATGTIAATGAISSSSTVTGTRLISNIAIGTAPLTVTSTTVVANLNADDVDGYDAGNASGNVPVSNGTVNTNLNADLLDGYTTGNASGNIPLSNGTVNTNLNSDMVDGKHYTDLQSDFDTRYVNVAGDTMTNALTMSGASSKIAFDTASVGLYNTAGDVYINDSMTATGAVTMSAGALINTYTTGFSGWNYAVQFPNTSHAALYYPTGGLMFGMHSNTNFYWANTTGGWYSMILGNTGDLTTRGDITVQGSDVYLTDTNTRLSEGGGNALRMQTDSGYIDIGAQNTSWAHIQSDRASFYFNPKITVDGNVEPYTTNTKTLGSASLYWSNAYLTTLTVSSTSLVSNLNADMVDGKHYADLQSDFDTRYVNTSGDTMTGRLGQSTAGFHVADKDDISTRTDSGYFQTSSPTTAEGWPVNGSWYHLLASTHSNDGNYYSMQFAADFFDSANLYYRSSNCGAITGCTTAWNKIWHAGNDANAGSWTLSGSNLYPDSTSYNVAIGGSAPAAKLHVTGNTYIDTSGNAAVDRNVTIKNNGQGQINFGAYPGAWTAALQIQNNDNTRQVWLSPLDNGSGANARLRVGATGLDVYTNGTTTDTGTLAASFSSGELVAASLRAPSSAYGTGAPLDVGDAAVDYPANAGWNGTYNATVVLSGLNSTSIGFHDAAQSVGVLRYTGNNFYIGETGPWGTSSLTVGGNINLGGQLQADKVCYFTSAFTVNGSTTSCAAGYCVNAVINDTTKNVMAAGDYNQRGVTQFTTGRLECCRCSISYP